MMEYGLLSRKDSGSNKCPKCSRVGVDFMDLGFGLLACFECGSAFVRKEERVRGKCVPGETYRVQGSKVMEGGRRTEGEAFPGRAYFVNDVANVPFAIEISQRNDIKAYGEHIKGFGIIPGEVVPPPGGYLPGEKQHPLLDPKGVIAEGFPCLFPGCGKVCKNKIGLAGHKRSHK